MFPVPAHHQGDNSKLFGEQTFNFYFTYVCSEETALSVVLRNPDMQFILP